MIARTILAGAAVLLLAAQAEAGTFKCGGGECKASFAGAEYSSSKCQQPPEPALSVDKPEAYNESVKKAEEYVNKVKSYYNCLTDEANADIKDINASITNSVKRQQDAEKAKIDKIQVTLKNAADKLNAASGTPAPAAPAKK